MEKGKKEELVSIIIPVYNASKFLEDTIKTVEEQTYNNYEVIFIDDCSTDNSIEILKKHQENNTKIKIYINEKNSGAATTRNNGIKNANGRYICFLDSDDLWEKDKLKKQVKFMKEKDCAFSFTGYEFANENGVPNGKKVFIPEKISYKEALKNTTIWTSTVMFDMNKLTKEDVYMPDVRRGQDTATWWKVLRTKVDNAYGLNEILSYYRRTNDTLSSNKIKALKRTWYLYRKVEKLNIVKSSYCFIIYCINAVRRRI